MRIYLVFCILLIFPEVKSAEIARIFTSNMVLQRGIPLPVWGSGRTLEKVIVTMAGTDKWNQK